MTIKELEIYFEFLLESQKQQLEINKKNLEKIKELEIKIKELMQLK